MNRIQFNNPIIKAFLSQENNLELYKQYCTSPSESLKKNIDERFVKFYAQIRMISYFSKLIYHMARSYDIKNREFKSKYISILDSSVSNEGTNDNATTFIELVEDETALKSFDEELERELGDIIQNPVLYRALLTLTEREKEILYLSYIKGFSDTEISKQFGVSQQAISKSKNKALTKMRRLMNV